MVENGTLGTLAWGGPPVTRDTWWDLASVTKPIVGLAVMSLVENGELRLDDAVADLLDDYRGTDKAAITVRQLLTHTSGMPGQVPLFSWCRTRAQLLDALRELPLCAAPGERVVYSSQGFMVLGRIAEVAAGMTLDRLVDERVTTQAGLRSTLFGPPPTMRPHTAATEWCAWRGVLVQGRVHDENAEVLGGVAGHAGLFATLDDLERLAQLLCRDGGGIVGAETFATMTAVATPGLALRRGLAWQGRDVAGCPAGTVAGPRSFGHTGFTGTSLWVDPDLGYVVLLTNRVHPSRADRGFDAVRAAVHDAAFRLLGGRTRWRR